MIRIPEVSMRIRQAQTILDSMGLPPVDLFAVLSSDDEGFFHNIALKGLLAAIVQVGLYDRYIDSHPAPEFLVGSTNGDSALLFALGRISFEGMVRNSQAIPTLGPSDQVVSLAVFPVPLLSGLSLVEYGAFEAKPNDLGTTSYDLIQNTSMELKKIISSLHTDHGVSLFINFGPGSPLRISDYRMFGTGDLEAIDSIELDPMLSWFWRDQETGSLPAQLRQ